MEREILKETVVDAEQQEVWKAWTTEEGARTFFAPEARIVLAAGGAYEMYFLTDAPPGSRGSEGCTVVEYDEERRLVFTWNFPTTLPSIRNEHTRVSVTLAPAEPGRTRVTVRQTGWKEGKDWDQGFLYFQRAWALVLARLEYRFENGPIDWQDPYTPGL